MAPYSDELGYCADEINKYRRTLGLTPLARAEDLEGFAAVAARVDGTAHAPHTHFGATNGAGTAFAETEILWWRGFSVRAVIREGLAIMWQQGPGGEHYDILAGRHYTQVGCGVFFNSTGEVTVSQDFR